MKPYELYKSLRGRGEDLTSLSEKSKVARTTISSVFQGKRGSRSRKYIAPHLTTKELNILGWNSDGELVGKGEQVPCETTSQM